MASVSFTHFLSLPRWNSTSSNYQTLNFVQLQDFRLQNKWGLAATSRKKISEALPEDEQPSENGVVLKKKTTSTTTRKTKRATSKTKKKASDMPEQDSELELNSDVSDDESSKKTPGRTRRKATVATTSVKEENIVKKPTRRRRTKKTDEGIAVQGISESDISDGEESTFVPRIEEESDGDLELEKDDEEGVSSTYGWPPLVCCFGAAQHSFVPSGRPANRLLNYEIHDRMKDAYWEPEKFMRAPGGCAGSVAIALATLGGKVAFMGKLGDDEYGHAMLYYMNVNNVQTRSVRIDSKRTTATSEMKIAKRGRLRTSCVKPCAEDSLSKSELNMDVLKEAKMFYFSTQSLLDRNMRSSTLKAIRVAKKLGSVIFYDLNLPIPLWQSSEETKLFIEDVWNQADIIEVTKQELEFLCGIKPAEEFDTRNNDSSKFVHYGPEVVQPLWHEDLKILFITNGTSKIHYYTKEYNGSVHGMEDPPITPFTSDMSASGDGIVAAIMRMLTVQPHLLTDKEYLEHTLKYAINCGVTDQWLLGWTRGFPPKEDMEDEVEPDPNGIKSITEKEYRTTEYHTWSVDPELFFSG